jgi:hypothetical protein
MKKHEQSNPIDGIGEATVACIGRKKTRPAAARQGDRIAILNVVK